MLTKKDITRINEIVLNEMEKFGEVKKQTKMYKPKEGETYYYIADWGYISPDLRNDKESVAHKKRIKFSNCFKTAPAAEREALRRESMAQRGEEPKEGEVVWFYSFFYDEVRLCNYDKGFTAEYTIGNIKRTEKESREWHKKYGSAFLNLNNF